MCIPREGQENCGNGASVLTGLAGVAHRDGDQTDGEETSCRDHTADSGVRLLSQAEQLLRDSRGGTVLNTAFIERLNATFRARTMS
jgi:hypothetical protein